MAGIELVIKIPEEMYQNVLNGTYCGTLYEELKNGTPLPKGHGRLIDADAVTKDFNTFQDSFVINMADLGRGKISIGCLAPTIIKADQEAAE